MGNSTKHRLIFYWRWRTDFYAELQSELTAAGRGSLAKYEIDQKLLNIQHGRARNNTDVKKIAIFRNHQLSEVRWNTKVGDDELKIRLFFCQLLNGDYLLLRWHVKDSNLPLEEQRHLQNQAARQAIARKDEFLGIHRNPL
jgi:hypothetical protein